MLTTRDLPLLWQNSSTAATSTAPHNQGELNPNHVDVEEEEREEESEGGMSDEGAPYWPKLYTTGIVPEAKSAPSARHFDAGIR